MKLFNSLWVSYVERAGICFMCGCAYAFAHMFVWTRERIRLCVCVCVCVVWCGVVWCGLFIRNIRMAFYFCTLMPMFNKHIVICKVENS